MGASNVNRTQTIKNFLEANTHADLASQYSYNMECQVNVARDSGERIKGEYKGKQWNGWTDNDGQVWKSFRIPYNANSEPTYQDKPLGFNLNEHAEGIGMTGWDWVNKVSKWVAYDFDAIIGHSDKHPSKLTAEQLNMVRESACKLSWTTIRRSTSGKGLHVYVYLDDVPTANHTEHAALARSILHLMSLKTGFAFESHVDICGSNMWVWHRKLVGTDGLKLIKQGDKLEHIPPNWRDHLEVTTGRRKRIKPGFGGDEQSDEQSREKLLGQKQHIPLDSEHLKLIDFLDESGASFWWDQDHYMLVAHTFDILKAHTKLGMRGVFTTISKGEEHGTDHNCFMYPLRNGSWTVRRYTRGVRETNTWEQDGKNWTRCFLNREPDLRIVARLNDGVEQTTGGFVFHYAEDAQKAATALNVDFDIPNAFLHRETTLKQHKDGRLIVQVKRESHDDGGKLRGWLADKNSKWTQIFDYKPSEPDTIDVGNYDDLVRHTVTENGSSMGWVIQSEKQWTDEPLAHVNVALRSMGLKPMEIQTIVGNNVFKPWVLVNRPFEPQYPGNRLWNRDAAQFRYAPTLDKDSYNHPTWNKILEHVGLNLDGIVKTNPWCQENGLSRGADYLKCWIASMFQFPYEQLPYLFLWGSQNCGKSIFHESLQLLMTKGCVRADNIFETNFNGELERAVLCVIEETDMQKNKKAYNMIKDFVTALHISLHVKNLTPVMMPNTTHWCQCANEPTACPIFQGDTRITVIHVPELKVAVPKRTFMEDLRKEAPDFLASVLKLEIPRSEDRLNIPVLESQGKQEIVKTTYNLLQIFIEENCFRKDGHFIKLSEFHKKFQEWLDPGERFYWTKHKVSKMMDASIPKGRDPATRQWCYGNITFDPNAVSSLPLHLRGDILTT